ncbi:MAG: hypothetical protein Kow00124_05840 [Anaerolineae bacterium]
MEEGISIRRSIWISSLITLAALALFIGVAMFIPSPEGGTGLLLLSLFLALVPALIWLAFFYQQDRSEPEPKRLVARMFIFGALGGLLVATPAVSDLLQSTINQAPNLVVRFVITLLTLSLLQELIKVAMVRYVILGTVEFDRHPDGIVYGLAAGLGFATMLTIAYVLRSSGVIPLASAIRAVDNALVHGVLAAVSGYYIGRVKIDGKKLGWMVQGLAIVTVINALYQTASDQLSRLLTFNPWYSLMVSAVLAVIVGVVLFLFFQRALLRASGVLSTVSVQAHARSKVMPWDIHERYDRLLIGGLVAAVAVLVASNLLLSSRSVAYSGGELPADFRYPVGWSVRAEAGSHVSVIDLASTGGFKPMIFVESNKVRADSSLDLLVADQAAAYASTVTLYDEIDRTTDLVVDGQPATQIWYRYAASTPSGPALIEGINTYVLAGGHLYTFRYEAEADAFAQRLSAYERVLRSARLRAGQ